MPSPTEIFVQKALAIHGHIYDYSKVNYVKAKTKVCIICPAHGEFQQTPNNHLSGYKCPMCRGYFPQGSHKKAQQAIDAAKNAHGDLYDYSMIDFYNLPKGKVTIICKIHGPFDQLWNNHVGSHNKNGCPQCASANKGQKQRLGTRSFIEKAMAVHGTKYDYSKCNYVSAHEKVIIICHNHGEFECTPANHWSKGVGCTQCLHSNPSKGEAKIAEWLDRQNIEYTYQKSYPDLYWKSKNGRLKYDFWLPSWNTLIEYDGEHHHQPISWSKSVDGQQRLEEQKTKDRLKNKYAEQNGLKLLRIKYDQNIDQVLELFLRS